MAKRKQPEPKRGKPGSKENPVVAQTKAIKSAADSRARKTKKTARKGK